MALVASDVLNRVRTILQDTGSTRWLLTELADWLDDALLDICFYKPTACSEAAVLDLVQGTQQTLPDNYTQLLRVVRNITSDAASEPPRIGGPAITPIEREILDAHVPGWHDSATVPQSATVRHLMMDMMDPRTFYVYPGNDGTGRIEVLAAKQPQPITRPTDALAIEQYTDTLDIDPIYQSAIMDFMLARAFSKDMQFAGAAERAQLHFQNYMNALGARQQMEGQANVNTTQSQPNS